MKYSGAAEAFLAAACGGTLLLVALAPFAAPLAAAISVATLGLAAHARRKVRALRGLRLDAQGALTLAFAHGSTVEAHVRPGSFVAPWLVVIRWRAAGQRFDRASLVLPGMAPGGSLRRLRVLLRHGGARCDR